MFVYGPRKRIKLHNKALQGTSGQRGFPKIALLPKMWLTKVGCCKYPLAPELKR